MQPIHSKPVFCYVTNRKSLGGSTANRSLLEKIKLGLSVGADWVQIREKDLSGRDLLALAREALEIANGAKSPSTAPSEAPRILINDRLDIAMASGAAGVHLGRESLPASEVVGWYRAGIAPPDFLIGVSCHSTEEARKAEADGGGYVFFGPIFDSPEKRQYGQPQGISRLKQLCSSIAIPVIAIGGINLENAEQCLEAGAAGIAAIRMFQEVADVTATIEQVERLRMIR